MIPSTYKINKHINIIGIDKVHSKCDCFICSIVNGIRQPILFSLGVDKPPGHNIFKESKIKLFKRINTSVLFQITFYLEDNDPKPVDYKNKTISFTGHSIKI